MNYRILAIDDDKNICDALKLYLEKEGNTVKTACDGEEGIRVFKIFDPDIILLDIMMPKKDGWETCRELREISSTPIIMLSAKDEIIDKVVAFKLGVDDYLSKPFDMKELSARINTIIRRCHSNDSHSDSGCVKFDNLEVSLQKYELKIRGEQVDVPPKELELLYFLASHSNRVFTRDQLLIYVWKFKSDGGDSRTVDVHVKRLREKLDGVSDKWALKTVWGVGYKFEVL